MPTMILLYEVIFHLVFILVIPWYVLAGLVRGERRHIRERLGFYRGTPTEHDVWIHAVSVGEVTAARAVIDRLLELRPSTSIVITSTTSTGQMTARRLFQPFTVAYYPFDFRWAVRRFLAYYRPRVYATMETEIWPNVSRVTSRSGVPMILANARISDRSFPRYRVIRRLIRQVLGAYDLILAREETDRKRFVAIGAPAERVRLGGNVKFDFEAEPSPVEFADRLSELADGRSIFVAGSTVDGEDEMLVPFLLELAARDVFVVIAPRKPARFEAVASFLDDAGAQWVRRTGIESNQAEADVLLLDTIGELPGLFRHAVAAFIGGSLIPRGGHNPIEPAAVGTPVAFGPHMSNFREVAATLLRTGGAIEVGSPRELVDFAIRMVQHPDERRLFSSRSLEAVRASRGAARRNAEAILERIG